MRLAIVACVVLVGSISTAFAETAKAGPSPTATVAIEATIDPLATASPTATNTPIPFPTLSPDFERNFQILNPLALSGRIAFSTAIDGLERVMLLDLNSGRVRKLIEGPGNNSYPTWSHDGRKVVFTSDRDGNKEIYIADWDGSNQTRLTKNDVADDNATWTPDDKHIVYYSDSNKTEQADSNIFMISAAGGNPIQLTHFPGRNTTPRVSPDGSEIAYSTNRFWPGWDVCIWRLSAKEESCVLQGKSSFCRAAWSPSGKLFAYSYGILDAIEIGYLVSSSKDRKVLTEMGGKEYDPVWSPSESLIAFVSETEVRGTFNLYVVDMQKKVTPLLKSPYSIRYPTWSGIKTFELEAERLRKQEVRENEEEARARAARLTPSPAPTLPEAAPATESTEQ